MRRLRPRVLAPAVALAVVGCSGSSSSQVPLSVFAASSLTEAFEDLERGFEAAHAEIDVTLAFAGSQVLRLQIEQGAAADVFASADERHMLALVDAGLVDHGEVFATNELVVIVPRDAPDAITRFADLPSAQRIVVGTKAVPVGKYAAEMLDRADAVVGEGFAARVHAHVVSEESNVRLVRAKVELGEADAAIVYRTDAVASDRVRIVDIPAEINVRAKYPIGTVASSTHAKEATSFIAYVRSPDGRTTLQQHGFSSEDP